jgi:hypothetical protein
LENVRSTLAARKAVSCIWVSCFSPFDTRGWPSISPLPVAETIQMRDLVIGLFVNRYAFGRAV